LIDPNGDSVTHSLAYSYDGLGQLIDAAMTNINSYTWRADYSYYKDGNIASKTVNSDTTDFDYTGDLMTDIGADTLTWDYNGQLTESTIASLEYNWSGKLRSATAGADSISLKYDPLGNRVYKEIPGSPDVKRRYIVDIAGKLPVILLVMDAGNNNSVERSYVYAGAQPVAFYEGDYTDPSYFYLSDRLGSVRQVLDESGNVKNTYTYTPFGQDPNNQFSETVDNPFRFTGQWYDSETGQYYLRARQYEPQLMRFCAIDQIRGKYERPITNHTHLYCGNNPINYIDLDGKWAVVVGGSFSSTIGTRILGQASETGIASLAKGNLGYHALMRQALIGLLAMEVDVGLGGTFGGGIVFGHSKDNDKWFFGSVIYGAGGGGLTTGRGGSLTFDLSYSPNAQSLQDLGGWYWEYGGSATFEAPVGVPFWAYTVGGSYSIGDNGTELWTASIGVGKWSFVAGAEGHVYRGHAWVSEW